jgi:pimeloyl-ACP methyl ester carboxylesterase
MSGGSMLNHTKVNVSNGSLHIVESGSSQDPAVLFLHGWPENWSAYEQLMQLAGKKAHALSIDLPGIGESSMKSPPSTKRDIADCIHELVEALQLKCLTLVGHDAGGQVVFSYLSRYADELERAVIMNVAVPGIKPWEDIIRNPYIWHFHFHSIPNLPETLVTGKERQYFDYFYNIISAHPEKISEKSRSEYAKAYSTPSALNTGFNWYRAFYHDAKENNEILLTHALQIETPLLYLRGELESGAIEQYVEGFKEAGIKDVRGEIIQDSGHFAPEEQPEAVWKKIAAFMELES